MRPLCISTATWFLGSTLLPAALAAVFAKIPSSSGMDLGSVSSTPRPSIPANLQEERKHNDG